MPICGRSIALTIISLTSTTSPCLTYSESHTQDRYNSLPLSLSSMSLASFSDNLATLNLGNVRSTSFTALLPASSESKHRITSSNPSMNSRLATISLTAELAPRVRDTMAGSLDRYFLGMLSTMAWCNDIASKRPSVINNFLPLTALC